MHKSHYEMWHCVFVHNIAFPGHLHTHLHMYILNAPSVTQTNVRDKTIEGLLSLVLCIFTE